MKKYFSFALLSSLLIVPSMAFAEVTPIDVDGVFTDVTTSVSSAITNVLPAAGVVLGAIMAIRIGLKIYKTVVGR